MAAPARARTHTWPLLPEAGAGDEPPLQRMRLEQAASARVAGAYTDTRRQADTGTDTEGLTQHVCCQHYDSSEKPIAVVNPGCHTGKLEHRSWAP